MPLDKDLIGQPASQDLRETPKNWGKRKVVGIIKGGVYIDTDTDKPKDLTGIKIKTHRININWIGGCE